MNSEQHAQLLRELADAAEAQAIHLTSADAAWKMADLAARARQAAAEIEGRREPTEDELQAVFSRCTVDPLRFALARFGGGEGKS